MASSLGWLFTNEQSCAIGPAPSLSAAMLAADPAIPAIKMRRRINPPGLGSSHCSAPIGNGTGRKDHNLEANVRRGS